jgi:cell division septation protein DedD
MRFPLSFCAGLAVLLLPELCHAGESLATTLVNAGIRQASLAAAGPLPLVETVCGLMQQQAEANGLPPLPFVRLIWKESRFDPQAISPKGAKGIAQFMPGTAEDRGLHDPFEPGDAIVHSASLLADLQKEFGNFGLAAAAYNAGEERVRDWISGNRSLPEETRDYVRFITGRPADEWKLAQTELPKSLQNVSGVQDSCRRLAPLIVRAIYKPERLVASDAPQHKAVTPNVPRQPWAVHITTAFSKAKALSEFEHAKSRFKSALSGRDPLVKPEHNLSRGRVTMYMVQIGAKTRADADALCAKLRSSGGACMVQKN